MKSNLDVAKIDRRRLLTTLAGGGAALIGGAANATPERVFHFSAPGDVVIVTTDRLVATDPGRPTYADLQRRLDQALRDRKVRDHVAVAPSRSFALSSLTLSGPLDGIACLTFQSVLILQSQIAGAIFGDDDNDLAVDYLPFYIATSIEDNEPGGRGTVLDMLVHITCSAGFWHDAKTVNSSTIFSSAVASRKPGELDLIALWPFVREAHSRPERAH